MSIRRWCCAVLLMAVWPPPAGAEDAAPAKAAASSAEAAAPTAEGSPQPKSAAAYEMEIQQLQQIIDRLTRDNAVLKEREAQLTKQLAGVRASLGKTWEERTDLLRQMAHVQRSAAQSKQDVAYNMGVLYLQTGRTRDAVREFQRALTLNPQDADGHYNLAIAYDHYLHQPQAAAHHYEQYLFLKPQAPDAPQVRQWLDRARAEANQQDKTWLDHLRDAFTWQRTVD